MEDLIKLTMGSGDDDPRCNPGQRRERTVSNRWHIVLPVSNYGGTEAGPEGMEDGPDSPFLQTHTTVE